MKWIAEDSLVNFPAWSGGRDTLDFLVSHGLCGEVEEFIEQMWPNKIPEDGEVNDLLWFNDDEIAEHLGYESWEDMERKLDGEDGDEEEEEE